MVNLRFLVVHGAMPLDGEQALPVVADKLPVGAILPLPKESQHHGKQPPWAVPKPLQQRQPHPNQTMLLVTMWNTKYGVRT